MSLLLVITSVLTLILLSIYFISRKKFDYWKKKNVPHLQPKTLVGNYGDFLLHKKLYGRVAQEICQAFPEEPYVGAYFGTEPTLIVQDPEIIKLITTKDFYYFNSREIMDHADREKVNGLSLFLTFGDRWKVTKQHMTPLFTSAKMKNMFHLIEKCSHVLEDMLDRECKISNVQEIRTLLSRFTMDCICSCGFGIDTNTMADDAENNPFYFMGGKLFEVSNAKSWAFNARSIWPSIFYGLGFQAQPPEIAKFFNQLITNVFKSRQYKPSSRNDFVDLILDWTTKEYLTSDPYSLDKKNTGKISLKVDDDLLVAQCVIFFAAGYETSATTLSYTLYELAKDPEAQKKAIDEVDAYMKKNKNKLDYNCVTELPYLEACLDEALRLYPVLSVITREVVEDYTLPSGLKLDKKVRIHLPVYHMHHNPKYFPEPEQYRPERFFLEQKKNIKPYTYMPFGEGQRICIGMRFAKMQTLSGLVSLLKKYKVELADGMPHKLEFNPRSFVTITKSGIRLRLVEREGWEQRRYNRQSTTSDAISDFLLGVFCLPFTLVGQVYRRFLFGAALCKLIPFLQAVSVSVDVWTLVAISLERYFAICRPLKSRKWQTQCHAYKMIATVWMISIMLNSPILLVSTLQPMRGNAYKCREVWTSLELERAFNLGLDGALLLVPLFIMSFAYALIVTKLWRGMRHEIQHNFNRQQLARASSCKSNHHLPTTPILQGSSADMLCCKNSWPTKKLIKDESRLEDRKGHPYCMHTDMEFRHVVRSTHIDKSIEAKRKVIRMLFVLMIEFFVCWAPLHVINTIYLFYPDELYQYIGSKGIVSLQLLAYCSSCCNPITYCFMNRKFRQAFISLIKSCRLFRRCFAEKLECKQVTPPPSSQEVTACVIRGSQTGRTELDGQEAEDCV